MMQQRKPKKKTIHVQYAIVDGEHEYGDYFFLKRTDGMDHQQEAYQEIADMYAYDDDERREIMAALQKEGMAMIGSRAVKHISVKELKLVTILVRGGVIQDILHIPPGLSIRVQDYDVKDLSEQELREHAEADQDGDLCVVSVWGED